MSETAPAAQAVARFAALIREATGNVVPANRYDFLAEVAARRAHVRGRGGVADYVHALAAGQMDAEWEAIVPLVTIKESYFFRAPQQFEAIRARVLPELLAARAATRQLRIWSAACARGEEPATLALALADEPSLAGWDWTILASDVDEEALAGARLGLYGERAIAQVPPPLLERRFRRRGKLFELDPALRERIDYRAVNLAHPPFVLPHSEFDLVLLRNVLIYFRRPLQRWVMSQVAQTLSRAGFLFLGASETLWQIQDELEAVDLGACFSYRHRRPRPAEPPASRPARRPPRPAPPPEPPPQAASPSWLDLQDPRAWSAPRSVPVEAPAAAAAEPAPAAEPPLAHERLLAAARDLAANRMEEAAGAIAEALAAAPSEPAAHALDGFVHDLSNRVEEAVTSYRAALYLDPTLYQIRLLLADCLLRRGHRERAEHQFREVLATLSGGRERRLELFDDLPLPDRERALRRCRQVLKGG
jgi:chemotaxis protein methyltransferase CheR